MILGPAKYRKIPHFCIGRKLVETGLVETLIVKTAFVETGIVETVLVKTTVVESALVEIPLVKIGKKLVKNHCLKIAAWNTYRPH